jgi:hypothetical protein
MRFQREAYKGNFAGRQSPRSQRNTGLSVHRHDPVTRLDHRFCGIIKSREIRVKAGESKKQTENKKTD